MRKIKAIDTRTQSALGISATQAISILLGAGLLVGMALAIIATSVL